MMRTGQRPPKVRARIHYLGPRFCYPGNPWPQRYPWVTDPALVTCGKCRRTRAWKAAS